MGGCVKDREMMNSMMIAPSILSADFSRLGDEVRAVEEAGAEVIHVDVMDGHFVPNITIGPLIVRALRPVTQLPLDVHLMIENPADYITAFAEAGADYITVHAEATPHLHRVVQQIKNQGVKVGVSLNPHTPLSVLEELLHDLDLILIMSVNPGFGGQSFIPNSLDKLKRLQKMLRENGAPQIEVEVDGGIKLENIKAVADAGCDIFVSGSGIFGAENPHDMIAQMKQAIR